MRTSLRSVAMTAAIIRSWARRSRPALGFLLLLGSVLAASAAVAGTLPVGFQETPVITGRDEPTAVRFLPDGQLFVAEKSGLIWAYDEVGDTSATQVIDLRAQVHNFWDRGLLGMAPAPNFLDPGADPYLYVLYTHDTYPPGDPLFGQPRWGTGGPIPSTDDPCPFPPGSTADGCVVYGRLSRILVDLQTMTGTEEVLLEGNWCQQYPSHSIGDLFFGEDGYLYLSAGEGASFTFVDVGQDGDPVNPCDDPPDGIGGPNEGPDAEGGALRSQDILTPSDPTYLGGAVLRIDVSTVPVQAPPDNPLVGNAVADDDFIIAVGLRNPFRMNMRPGTNEVWIGDVGWTIWEEVNRIQDPTGDVENFGWPCYAGDNSGQNSSSNRQPSYEPQNLCSDLYAGNTPAGIVSVPPHFAYRHSETVVSGDACGTGTSNIGGIAFYEGGNFPAAYQGALFFADSSRKCIWTMFADVTGDPSKSNIQVFVESTAGRVVDLQMGPDGNLYYVDFDGGRIFRVEFLLTPTATIDASPTSGYAPLLVDLDASGSTDPQGGTNLSYAWDLDDDGAFDDSFLVATSVMFSADGVYPVRLRVEDTLGVFDVASVTIIVGNTSPIPSITAPLPTLEWVVNQQIAFAGEATDPEDGVLGASQLNWELILHHCEAPEDCHEHPVTGFEGVSSGTVDAPDHEYPSFLEFKLTATDLAPPGWFDLDWPHRRKLVFDNSGQSETLVDFPVLVVLDPTRIEYGRAHPLGHDLRFADMSGAELAYEIEAWDPLGTSLVWVRVPTIPGGSNTDFIWMYYGNPGLAQSGEDVAGVWSGGYAAVWHQDATLGDSTGNGNDGVDSGTSAVAGRIGEARFFDGASYIDAGSDPSLAVAGQLTVEAWVQRQDPKQTGAPRLVSKKLADDGAFGYGLELRPRQNKVAARGSGADVASASGVNLDTTWHYVAASIDGAAGAIYVDGFDVTADASVTPIVADATPLHIGKLSGASAEFLQGSIDEVRISTVARSADWIGAQHLSMSDLFVSYGAEEDLLVLSATASVAVQPQSVVMTFDSSPQGATIAVGSEANVTPFSETLIVGSVNTVSVNSPQVIGGQQYEFLSWSDGGEQSHEIVAPAAPETLVATFGVFVPECSDGIDNDNDGFIDYPADPGCLDASFPVEDPTACSDGSDNDNDGLIDYPDDPGCSWSFGVTENPECSDGLDNDGDALVDWDGAGVTDPDPQCGGFAWRNREAGGRRCGLGFEIAFVLALLLGLRQRVRGLRIPGARSASAGS